MYSRVSALTAYYSEVAPSDLPRNDLLRACFFLLLLVFASTIVLAVSTIVLVVVSWFY